TQWLKSVGDTVEADEPLLEVSTDKVDTEIPSPVSGTLLEIKAEEDDTIDVGSVIAIIGDEDESAGSSDSSDSDDSEESSSQEEESDSAEESSSSDSDDSASAASGDATDVEMPELAESVTEGTITQWLKSVGDTVEVDEPLLEVSTDKVDTEIPSPVAGTLVEILADEDDTIDVGSVIARIGDENAKPASDDKKDEPKEEPKKEEESDSVEESSSSDSDDSAYAASGDATEVETPELAEYVTEDTIAQCRKSDDDTDEVEEPRHEASHEKDTSKGATTRRTDQSTNLRRKSPRANLRRRKSPRLTLTRSSQRRKLRRRKLRKRPRSLLRSPPRRSTPATTFLMSRHWFASWLTSMASTSTPSKARALADASASRTSWLRQKAALPAPPILQPQLASVPTGPPSRLTLLSRN